MRLPEWPGIATAVGIILIVMVSFDLSKWQTLTAAIIAFGGGALAYRGVMAKIAQDAAEHKREFLRRQLSVYLKLDIALRRFQPEAQQVDAQLVFSDGHDDKILVKDLRLKEPPEIAEAWENLDVFPRKLIREIAVIRASVRQVDDYLVGLTDDKRLPAGNAMQSGTRLNLIHQNVSAIVDACALIMDGLGPEIEQLAPNISEHERILTLYGEPDEFNPD
jgi:hypothetical protein